jgi:RNA 3'-terminal phosphate cyclase (ATP)
VGKGAADSLIRNLSCDACVDEYLQDQLIVFMALAKGTSVIKCGEVTLHTLTAVWVAEKLTGAKFQIKSQSDGTNLIECEEIGYENSNIASN